MEARMLDCRKDILDLVNSIDFDVGYIYESQRILDEIKVKCNDLSHDLRPYSFVEWVHNNSSKFLLELRIDSNDIEQFLKNLVIKKYEYNTQELLLGLCEKELISLETKVNDNTVLITSTIERYIDIANHELFVAGIDSYAKVSTNPYYISIIKVLSRMSNIDDGDCYLDLLN